MPSKFLKQVAGALQEEAPGVAGGVGDAGKLAALDAAGQLAVAMLPRMVTSWVSTGGAQAVVLPLAGLTVNQVFVYLNGVLCDPATDYTIAGSTLTITAAAGDKILVRT